MRHEPFSLSLLQTRNSSTPGSPQTGPVESAVGFSGSGSEEFHYRFLENDRLRRVWERVGVVAISVLLSVLLAVLPVGPFALPRWLPFLWGFVFGGRFVCEALAGHSRGRWVPTEGCLVVAALLPECFRILVQPSSCPGMGVYVCFVGIEMAALGAMWIHARATATRTGSVLVGWLTGFPLAILLATLAPFSEEAGARSFVRRWLDPTKPETLIVCAGVAYAEWWMLVTYLELAYLWAEGRSRSWSDESRARRFRGGLLLLAPALPLASLWIYLATFSPALLSINIRYMGPPPLAPGYVILAMVVGVSQGLLGWLLALWAAGHGAEERTRRLARLLAWAGLGVTVVVASFGFAPEALPFPLLLATVLVLSVGADCLAGRRSADLEPSAETHVLRALAAFPRSPIRFWGAGRHRWTRWAAPPVIWIGVPVISLLACMVVFWVERRIRLTPAVIFETPSYKEGFYLMTLLLYFIGGVLLPLGVFLPIRTAGRFQAVWNVQGLSELYLTRLSPWEIVTGIVLSPSVAMVVLAATTPFWLALVASAVGLPLADETEWWMPNRNHGTGQMLFHLTVLALLQPLLVAGLARRRLVTSHAATALAWVLTLTYLLGLFSLPVWMLWPLAVVLLQLTLTTLFLAFVARWAFTGTPQSLERALDR